MSDYAFMRSGIGTEDVTITDPDIERRCAAIILSLMEKIMQTAEAYCSASKRDTITPMDMVFASRYCCKTFMESDGLEERVDHFDQAIREEEDNSDDEWDDSDEEVTDVPDGTFARCPMGVSKLTDDINDSYDGWDEWVPQDGIQRCLKVSTERAEERFKQLFD